MKTPHRQSPCAPAFTLLEVVVVLAITALVLSAVYSLAQGTLILADDVRRAERRDTRTQAFTTFCEHLFAELPATAQLNLSVTEEHGQYLTRLELQHVRSPFDETPDCTVTLSTQGQAGGGLRLVLTCKAGENTSSTVLFEELAQCEWQVLHPATQQWVPFWTDSGTAPTLIKVVMAPSGGSTQEQVFWTQPAEAVTQTVR